MSVDCTPIEIKRLGPSGLQIVWSDGHSSNFSSELLRQNCPCASCREQRGEGSHSAPIAPVKPKASSLRIVQSSLAEELKLERIWAVGNYALGMRWGDGHDVGIWTFDILRALEATASK